MAMMIFEDMAGPDSMSLWDLPAEESIQDEMLLDALARHPHGGTSHAPSRRPFWGLRWRRRTQEQFRQGRLLTSER
jgi:hypothetical protein